MDAVNRIESSDAGIVDYVQAEAAEMTRQTRELIRQNPGMALFIAGAAGIAVGWAIASLLPRPEPTWSERHTPEWLAHLARHAADTMGRFGP